MTFISGHRLAYYRYALPVPGANFAEGPGRWEILIDWGREITRAQIRKLQSAPAGISAKAMRFDALVHARSSLEMSASLVQDRLTPGAKVTLRSRLTQFEAVGIDDARVTAHIAFPDGSNRSLTLARQGDGVFEGEFIAGLGGTYPVRISADGRTLRGYRFTREAVRTAFAWAGGDEKPPSGHDGSWCSFLRCLAETKAVDPELLKHLGIDLQRLGKCCERAEPVTRAPRKETRTRSPGKDVS
jgi:hypothetical protein